MDQLYSYHKKSENGKSFLHIHAEAMDALILDFYNKATNLYEKRFQKVWSYPICLIGLGGYGRSELFPHSRVDLMLLYSEKIQTEVLDVFIDIFNETVIHPLWNLQINVNKRFGTISHAIDNAKKVFQIKNAQLDARFICGSKSLFNLFQESYERYFFQNEFIDYFIAQILEEKVPRHKKYGNTLFLLEPDIKYGLGGLRDYQIIIWISRAKFRAITSQDIVNEKLLNANQLGKLSQAHNFLIRVRSELHFQSHSPANLLNSELQPTIAWTLGYHTEDLSARVDSFMKEYYLYTQCIYNTVEIFEQNLMDRIECDKQRSSQKFLKNTKKEKKDVDGFILCENTFCYNSNNIFKDDPIRLIRIFKYAQQYQAHLSKDLKILIKNSISLIDADIINDLGFNKCFCAIFQSLGNVSSILKVMHEMEVLEVFVPEFRAITHLVYNDHFHRYTLDIHTLNTITLADVIFQNEDSALKHYYRAIKNTSSPWLLYLILFFHDLGKGYNSKKISEESMGLTKKILDRLSIDKKEKEYVLLAIENQLLMKDFWKNSEIYDFHKIEHFASLIQSEELLNYLYVSTYCDVNETSFCLWNRHKEKLHLGFFENVKSFFLHNKDFRSTPIQQKNEVHWEFMNEKLTSLDEKDFQNILELYPENYCLLNEAKEIELHFQLLKQLDTDTELLKKYHESIFPIIHWESDLNQCFTSVTIITLNSVELLKKLSGTLYFSGYNILHTKIFTRKDNISIHTFWIIDTKNSSNSLEHSKRYFLKTLNETLRDNNLFPNPNINFIKEDLNDNEKYRKDIAVNTIIDVHQDISHLIRVEIRCNDRVGLVYKIASILAEEQYKIEVAKISTEYKTIISTFYLTKSKTDNSCHSSYDLLILRERLNEGLLN